MFKKTIMILFTFVLILCGCNNVQKNSETSSTKNITSITMKKIDSRIKYGRDVSKKDLLSDLDSMIKSMEEIHPNLYAFRDKDLFNRDVEKIKSSITGPMNKIEFFKLVTPLIVSLGDGHTYPYYPWKEYKRYLFVKGKKVFPLILEIRDNKAFFLEDLSKKSDIPVGAHITAINNVQAQDIIKDFKKYLSAERDAFKEISMERKFHFLMWLEYGDFKDYSISYNQNNIEKKVVVPGVSYKTRSKYWDESLNDSEDYSYRFIDDDTCYLDFNSFTDLDSFSILLKSMFKEIHERETDNLIIDIRDNGGGNSDLGVALASCIYNKPLFPFSHVNIKLSSKIDENELSNQNLLGTVFPILISPYFDDSLENRFDGRVSLLINRYTFSSSTAFASIIKDFNMGVILGEETGGLASCYGDVNQNTLENTGFKFGVSFKHFIRPNGDESPHGVIPDIPLKQSYEDIQNGEDTVLDYALNFMKTDYDEFYKNMDKSNCIEITTESYESVQAQESASLFLQSLSDNNFNKIEDKLGSIALLTLSEKEFSAKSKELQNSFGAYKSSTFNSIKITRVNNTVLNYKIQGSFVGEKSSFDFNLTLDSNFKISNIGF